MFYFLPVFEITLHNDTKRVYIFLKDQNVSYYVGIKLSDVNVRSSLLRCFCFMYGILYR